MKENKMLGVFLVFIYLNNVLDVRSRCYEFSKIKIRVSIIEEVFNQAI